MRESFKMLYMLLAHGIERKRGDEIQGQLKVPPYGKYKAEDNYNIRANSS